ncbi:MAG: hypothetical protein Q7T91_03305 [Sulfuricurvum sp.]|nr:hypothetical protein [Sulfuricurvum sp.]
MVKEFIDNLNIYANCYLQVDEKRKNELFNSLHDHRDSESIILLLEKVSFDLKQKHNFFQDIVQSILDSLNSMADIEEKQTADHERWNRIKRFEKDRKNIIPYIKALTESLELYEVVNEPLMSNRINIAILLLESFIKDDELTIENMTLIYFHSKSIIHDKTFDREAKKFIPIPFDPEKIIEIDSLIKKDLVAYMPEISPYTETYADLVYLASLSYFFEGYRLTPQMILRSIAIRLFNLPLSIPYGYENEDGNAIDELYKINKSALKRSIESLLMPFSQSEKFTIDIRKTQKYYVKTYFQESPILALEGKKNKNGFRNFFNPEQYYSAPHHDPKTRYINLNTHKTRFL